MPLLFHYGKLRCNFIRLIFHRLQNLTLSPHQSAACKEAVSAYWCPRQQATLQTAEPVRPLEPKHSHSTIEHVSGVGYRVVLGVYPETLLDPIDGRPVLKRNLD